MVIFSFVPDLYWFNVSDNSVVRIELLLHLLLYFFCHFEISIVMSHDDRSVLSTGVSSLLVQGSWIVHSEKDIKDLCKRQL